MSSDPFDKPILVLRAKNGGHVYHVISKKTLRGGAIEWLVRRPDDDMFEAWLPKDKVLELAEPAWEWDDTVLDKIVQAQQVLVELFDVNNDFRDASLLTGKCVDHILRLRNGEL